MDERCDRSRCYPERSEGPPKKSLSTRVNSRDPSADREVPRFARNDNRV
jgi:hypothetical protein